MVIASIISSALIEPHQLHFPAILCGLHALAPFIVASVPRIPQILPQLSLIASAIASGRYAIHIHHNDDPPYWVAAVIWDTSELWMRLERKSRVSRAARVTNWYTHFT